MSTPSGPDFSKDDRPPRQPGWDPAPPPPPGGYGSPAAGGWPGSPTGSGGGPVRRPGAVTGAAVVGIVWGGLGTLFGLLALSVAFGLGLLVGLVVLVSVALSVGLLIGGIRVVRGESPRLLLVISYVAIGINLLSLVIALMSDGGSAANGLLGFVLPGIVVALLLQPSARQYYAARGISY